MSNNEHTTVVVTGASGFLGSQIVKELLDHGYTVRGTVRQPENSAKYAFLDRLAGADERLTLWKGELLTPGSFDEAVAGADYVIHTASPYALDPDDAQRDLVDPAVQGTTNVLEACARSGSVRRVVVTSSMAAVTDAPEPDHVLTERDWNEQSSLTRNPYFFSKVMAEKQAWKLAETAPYELVVINPFMIIGPSIATSLNTSNKIFADLLSGEYPAIMRLTLGLVDVRDVAAAHRLAIESETAAGRNLCVEHTIDMAEIVALLRAHGYADYRLPRLNLACRAGDLAIKALSIFEDAGTRSYLRTNLGRRPRFDNAKIKRDLGVEFRDLETTILETVDDLIEWGHVA